MGGWAFRGFDHDQQRRWTAAGFSTPDAADPWRSAGFALDVVQAAAFARHGFAAEHASAYRTLGLEPETAAGLRDAEVTPKIAHRWLELTDIPAAEIASWLSLGAIDDAGDPKVPAMPLADVEHVVTRTGISVHDLPTSAPGAMSTEDLGARALAYVEAGATAETLTDWLEVGESLDQAQAVDWIKEFRESPTLDLAPCNSSLVFLRAEDFSSSDMSGETLVPFVARAAVAEGFSAASYRQWLPVTPAVAGQARRMGFNRAEYKAWFPMSPSMARAHRRRGEGAREAMVAQALVEAVAGLLTDIAVSPLDVAPLMPPNSPLHLFLEDWHSLGTTVEEVEMAAKGFAAQIPTTVAGADLRITNVHQLAAETGLLHRPASLLVWLAITRLPAEMRRLIRSGVTLDSLLMSED